MSNEQEPTKTNGVPTPGPWTVRAATFCEDGVPSYEVVMPGAPQMNACDARLIAAAPELLAACRKAKRYMDGLNARRFHGECDGESTLLSDVYGLTTALAKVEGKE